MDITQFIQFNNSCPICGENLTLYMQWEHSVCLKSQQVNSKHLHFEPFKIMKSLDEGNHSVDIIKNDTHLNIKLNSNKLQEISKTTQVYFFYLCNESGFKDKGGYDFEISLYKGCYYRSTPWLKFKRTKSKRNGRLLLDASNELNKDLIMKDESFSFKSTINDVERVYMLNLDYEGQETSLWHYSATEEQKSQAGFKPNLFEKKIPLLNKRPDFSLENRDKLIDRFDSWILMS